MLTFAANISLMFQEWDLLDRFAAARDAGFTAVEIQFPYETASSDLAKAREASDVEVVLINAPLLSPDHPAGSGGRPEQVGPFRECFGRIRDYAEALGARRVNILAGTSRPGDDLDLCRRVLRENLLAAHDALGDLGIQLLLEAINPHDVPGYLVDTFGAARRVLEQIPHAALLQLDLYHLARMGEALGTMLDGWPWSIGHVQFADAPGRHQPGTGALRLEADLDRLIAHGYSGYVAAEYVPAGPTAASLGWLPRWRQRYGSASTESGAYGAA